MKQMNNIKTELLDEEKMYYDLKNEERLKDLNT